MKNKKMLVPLLAVLAVLMTGCAVEAGPGQQGVLVSSWGDPTINGCLPEETQNYTTDDNYNYPARAISWDANTEPGAERGPYVVLSNAKDQAYMNIPLTVTFDMTTDCDKLKQFHRELGTKYSAWIGGTDGDTGWRELLQYVVGQPTEQTLLGISQKYTYQQLWNDEAVRQEYKNALQAELPKQSSSRTGNVEYFSNFVVTIGKPEPTEERLRTAKSGEQAALAEARASEVKATADANARKAAAEAELAATQAEVLTKQAEAQKQAAEIAGYGTGPEAVEAYLKAMAIGRNLNPYPSPIIPGAR